MAFLPLRSALLSGAALLLVASASAQAGNYVLTSTYTYSFTGDTANFHDIEAGMEGGSVDDSYGWGDYSSFNGDASGGSYDLSFDTGLFNKPGGPYLSEPYLVDSFAFGVMDALPGDPEGQQHLVLFMNPAAASNVQNIAFGTIFGTSNQEFTDDQGNTVEPYTEEQVIDALEQLHSGIPEDTKDPYRTIVDNFRDRIAKNANVGINGAVGTTWFTQDQGFSIVTFSDGNTIGSGSVTTTTTFTPVPEPASCAALGIGALALLRRRKRA